MKEQEIVYDYPKIKGVGGKRGRGNKNSLYSRKTTVKHEFEDLLRQLNFRHVLISYSNQGLLSLDELTELAELFAENNEVHVEKLKYSEYKNHRSSNKGNGKKLKEVIIYFKKDLSITKSPLNYSGSKDTLLPNIIKELPKHVGTFVDVLGGAFNVGSNIVATNKIIYNEINPKIYNIINWLITNDKEKIISDIEETIEKFDLEKEVNF